MLDVPGLTPLQGVGVYYGAAMTEAARYRDRDVCIVGGANSTGQGAFFFSRYARTVTMIIRAADLAPMMSQYLVDRIRATQTAGGPAHSLYIVISGHLAIRVDRGAGSHPNHRVGPMHFGGQSKVRLRTVLHDQGRRRGHRHGARHRASSSAAVRRGDCRGVETRPSRVSGALAGLQLSAGLIFSRA